ncbi:MAG TPA: 2-hydroxychromene-2-carboxylate isomerase [Sphingopyxis sp.]|nr:2-hydroxychromene-2-carboxylate isomerase [Sphingopyxis sp.]
MVSKALEFIFDFASPNAYLVMGQLADIAARYDAELRITPCLLGGIFKATGNRAPFIQYADAPAKMAYERLEMNRFIQRHSLTKFQMNPHFPINSLLIMRAAIAADLDGRLGEYIRIINAAMWEEGLKMDDPAVIQNHLDHHGFDGAALLARTQDDAVKAKLVANTQQAVERGVFGIPTFFVGDQMFFGKERLGQVEEALANTQH